MNALAPIAEKLRRCVLLLSSDSDGEVLAAVRALNRLLKANGTDIHGLAASIGQANGKKFTEADATEIYRRGVQEGKRQAEDEHHGGEDFHNVDGSQPWYAMATWCQRRDNGLGAREKTFIDDMASRAVWREPTEKQAKWLRSIFHRLGGKLP